MPTVTPASERPATDTDDRARRLAQEAVQEAIDRRDNGRDNMPPVTQPDHQA